MFTETRAALKYLRRRPVFAVTVWATLAAGIAVATTAFGIARAILWRPLPFLDADRLVFAWEEVERDGQRQLTRVTGARYAAWRDGGGGFTSISLFGAAGFTLETPAGDSTVRGVRVSANYFATLGIRPALGRTFTPDDERPGAERVIIVSDGFWRERLGARVAAVGETLRLSGDPYRVIGVMPPAVFPGWPVNPATVTLDADSRQFWVPIARSAALDQSARAHVFGAVARRGPGISNEQLAERLSATASADAPDAHAARALALRDQFVSDARNPLLALLGAALVVLLIACANLATLFASAYEARGPELAVRSAIGAGLPRLVRQLALEALWLCTAAALGGLLVAHGVLITVPAALPASVPMLTTPRLDLPSALFGVGLAAIAAAIFTAWPVTRLLSHAPMPRVVAVRSRGLVYRVFVVTQVALTMGLVPTAALLAQSLRSVEQQDAGFRIGNVLIAEIGLPMPRGAAAEDVARAEQRVLAALANRPGVEAVAAAYDHPLEANWSENPTIVGDATGRDEQRLAELRIVSPGYVEALDVALLDGRTFSERDTFDAPGVALVNEAFAREIGGRVLGRRIRSGTPRFTYGASAAEEFEIVGIVRNERVRGLERPAQPAFYLSTRQFPQSAFTLIVRTSQPPRGVAADLRAALYADDPLATFDRALPLETILATQLMPRRATTAVIGGFAVVALGLAALGTYGLLSLLVGSRRQEIGIRLAIGASPASLARRIVLDSLRIASIGIAIGSLLSLASVRVVAHQLVGVSRTDVPTLAGSISLLLILAIAGAILPALRAASIDPTTVLRGD